MNISRILKAFNLDTPVRYIINDTIIDDITTVRDWLSSGLCNHICLGESDELRVEDGAIIIALAY